MKNIVKTSKSEDIQLYVDDLKGHFPEYMAKRLKKTLETQGRKKKKAKENHRNQRHALSLQDNAQVI